MQKITASNRSSNVFTRGVPAVGYVLALVAALWIVAGRALFGAGGTLVPIFAVSFGPMLFIVMACAVWLMRKDAKMHGGATTPLIALVYCGAFVLAVIFGFLVPDRQDEQIVSAASRVFGDSFVGLSAGFGNTFGILTMCLAVASLILALIEKRKTERAFAGVDEDAEEARARENYTYEFLE